MRDGAPAVEQASGRNQESAAADRSRPTRRAGPDLKPLDQARIFGGAHNAVSASDDQRVQRLGRVRQRFGRERQS